MRAVLCLLLLLSGPLHAYETTHIWCVITGRDNLGREIVQMNLAPGQSRAVHLPAGTYTVNLGGDALVVPDNPPPYLGGFASMATGMRLRMFLGGFATQVSWSGGASAVAHAGNTRDNDSRGFSSLDGTHVASVSASYSEDGGNQGCGWITQDSWAASSAAGYADSSGISGFIEFRATAEAASHYSCGAWESWAECQGTFGASFTIPTALDTIIVTDHPPTGGSGGGGAGAWPALPDASMPAPPGGCAWQPTYVFNNVPSGGWYGLPASGSAIRFDALDTTRFAGITGFPAGSTWVDVGGQSHGPFTSAQSFSFADQPGGSVATFTVRADAGQIPALTGFQLAFTPDPGGLQAQILGPADVRIDAERLSAGQPPTQTSPLAVARGESVRFTAHVPGSCANTYQWRRNGVALAGETNPTLNLVSVGSEHYGAHSVVVQNESGTAESPGLVLEPMLYTLAVNAAGGTVTKSPDLASYEPGTVVTLQGTPAAGYTFAGWDGEIHSTANPVLITMDQNRSVTAWFGNPFGDTPRTIPGRIEAEDFDEGGEGVAYHDTDEANQGGSAYRTGSVDVVAGASGPRIGWSDTGEWLNYTVSAPAVALYRAVFRVSSGTSGGTARVRFSGGQTPADVVVPGTGSWGTFVEVASEPFSLPAGLQVMRFEYAQAGFDLDWIELQRVNSPPVANAGGPYTIDEGSSLILNGSVTDPDLATGDSHTFDWDLDDDESFDDATGATPTLNAAALSLLGLGSGTHTIHLRVTDIAPTSATASTTLTIRGTQTITFAPIADRTYGEAPFTVSATASSGLPVTFTSLTPSVVTVSGNTVTIVGAGTATIRASQAGDVNWQAAAVVDWTFTVARATPVIIWATPADITLGTPLSELQLNATANVPGTLTYDPPAGTLLNSGEGQVLTAAFTPADSANYRATAITTSIDVLLEMLGSVWAWGWGGHGELGTGQTGESSVPVAVSAPAAWSGHRVASVAAGDLYSLAVLEDGSVWAWGWGGNGQLGNGQTGDSSVPVAVSAPAAWTGHTVVRVAAGASHSLAALEDGGVWTWGWGGNGQLGNGQTDNSSVPVAVSAPAAWTGHRVASLAAGDAHSLALLEDGSVWAWGAGRSGQLGNGQMDNSSVPVAVSVPAAWSGHRVTSLVAGDFHSLALLEDGSLWAWGQGFSGQLGNGQMDNSSVPVAVSAPAAWTGHRVVSLAANEYHSLAVLEDGSAWAWGYGRFGQLGNEQTVSSSVPVEVSAPAAWSGHRVASVAAGDAHSLALLEDASLWAWGRGTSGQLGNGKTDDSSEPVAVSTPAAWMGYRVVAVAASAVHSLVVLGEPNIAPSLATSIPAQGATYGAEFNLTVPANTFTDPDAGQTLTFSATGLPAWLAFDAETRTCSGTPTAVGTFAITVTATDDGSPALSASTTFDLVVGKTPLTATGDTLYRFYGEENPPLTGTLEGVVNGDNITASYMTWATPASAPAAYTIVVTLHDPDLRLSNYEVTIVNGLLHVQRAPQAIMFDHIANPTYGDALFAITATANSGLPVALTSLTPSVVTVSGNVVTIVGAGTATIRASQAGDANWETAADVDRTFTVARATPVITWSPPEPITSSTPLSAAQLNPTANVPGSFAYNPATGTTLPRGTHSLSADFTPGDTANYTTASARVSIEVLNSAPVSADDTYTTDEDTALIIASPGVLGNDTDADEGPMVRFRFQGHMTSTDADFSSGDALEGFYTIDPATAGVPDLDATTTLQFDSQNGAWDVRFPALGYAFSGDWVELNVGNDTAFGDRYIASFFKGSSVGMALPSGRQLSFAQFDLQDPGSQGADFLHDDSIQTTTVDLASAQIAGGRFLFEDNSQPSFVLDALQGPQAVTAVNGSPASVNGLVTLPSGATLRLNRNGSFRYDPNGQFNNLAAGEIATDSFTYEVSDPDGGSAAATATITITGVNDAPMVAVPISDFAVDEDAPDTVIGLGLAFTDIDTGDADLTLSVQVISHPGLVSATMDNVTDTVTLRYAANQFGTATLTLRATDSGGLFAEDTFVVTVQPVNDGDPGDLDTDFDPGANGEILGLALQPDDRILVAGNFTAVGGVARSYIARLNADGTLDSGFNVSPNSQVDSVLVQTDGRIILRGSFTAVNGVARNGVARVRPDGILDPDFNPNANGWVHSVALQADGKVLLGGSFTSLGGVTQQRIGRVDSSGALDSSFGPDANDEVIGIAVQIDGKIVLAGRFSTVSGDDTPYIARLTPTGHTDVGFGPDVNAPVLCVAIQADGKLLIGGFFDRVEGVRRLGIARLHSDGALDPSFNADLTSTPTSIAVLEDGRIMVAGYFSHVNGIVRNGIARLLPDGTLDTTFACALDGGGHGIALRPDGKVLLAGQFNEVGGQIRRGIARLQSDPASQNLHVSGPDRVEWLRGGAPLAVLQAIFELSSDGGATWSSLGAGTRTAGGWEKTGLSLTGHGLLRARAGVASGYYNGCAGLVGSVATFEFDQRPVAVAGADQRAVAGTDCMATVTLDGNGSSDADGDALGFVWELRQNGQVLDAVSGQAVVSWSLAPGSYEGVLTVSVDKNGVVVSHSDSLTIEVLASAPVLAALEPAAAYADAGGAGFNLTVTGGCFQPGAVVLWNGSPRPTMVNNPSQVTAVIPGTDLETGGDVVVAAVQVVDGDRQVSNPLGFSIVPQMVGTTDAAIALPGTGASVSTAPITAGEPGVSVTVNNGGTDPVSVLAATYNEKPVGETAFRVDKGAFVDVQIVGADENVAAAVWFYYPSTVTGGAENRVKLQYFDGANWMPVYSSRRRVDGSLSETNEPPLKDIRDNLDETVSGGRLTVVFDDTSTPTIMDLGGTVFGMFESAPQIHAITGPTGPAALGNAVGVKVDFAVVGDPADAVLRFLWDDGTESVVAPETATSAVAAHLYSAPGVYAVIVEVTDGKEDASAGRFEYVVIYDPAGGFVTGGGWIESPAGACAFDPKLTGRASFGFNAKYRKGQSVPDGQTQFQFQAGEFGFYSTAYEWLVVAGARAQYKGVGQINGTGDYGFLLTATDGQLNGGGGVDRFRIKVWDRASGAVVYDNRRGISDDLDGAEPQALGGGSIVIHSAR